MVLFCFFFLSDENNTRQNCVVDGNTAAVKVAAI